jgi:uncharacterized protein YprB with RNaseH-like and TPR domain/predicted nuclease with RNAse H fold/adenylate kinase family enzyme
MIEQTFLHLPGVGLKTERRLWSCGYSTWDLVLEALHEGHSPRTLTRPKFQRELFPVTDFESTDPVIALWLDYLAKSKCALASADYAYFLELLPPSHHWRLIPKILDSALYLDIETTGLSRDLHYVTVVGALFDHKFYQWVWPEPLDGLGELLRAAKVVVTFNGTRFDLPFLRAQAPEVGTPRAHVDLLPVARAAGLKGGQKAVEKELGLSRPHGIESWDGSDAVASWCSGLYGDRKSYRRLLQYNRADVEHMTCLAERLYSRLATEQGLTSIALPLNGAQTKRGRRPLSFDDLRLAWKEHGPYFSLLESQLRNPDGRMPTVVGIDLRATERNPTGFAVCVGARTETRILHTDDEILAATLAAKPDLVSIDAPLSLPRGRQSVYDDSPCRAAGGIVRDAERILWSRGIRVYPALIRQMQGLTKRGIELTRTLESHGIKVIESYPGAAQDILNIPRKRLDESLLYRGLTQFGYDLQGNKSHDELDAVTSALVGQFYLANKFEAIGADDEGFMIVPRYHAMNSYRNRYGRQYASLIGLPGSGKTTLGRAISSALGWRYFGLGDALRSRARTDFGLAELLNRGSLAPEALVEELVTEFAADADPRPAIIDGFPRHASQFDVAKRLFQQLTLIWLEIDPQVAASRLRGRVVCAGCGEVTSANAHDDSGCVKCGGALAIRPEDDESTISQRLSEFARRLEALSSEIEGVRVIRFDGTREIATLVAEVSGGLRGTTNEL